MKKWIWVVVAGIIAVAIWKRCEIPFIRDYLCKGAAAEEPVEMPGAPGGATAPIMAPTSSDPGAMAQMQAGMQQLGPGGGRDPVSGAFLPAGNANLARIRVS